MATNRSRSKAARRALPNNTHRMTTRSKASKFQVTILPPELRHMILAPVLKSCVFIDLAHFKLPAVARTSREMLNSALPEFFEINTFVITTYTNWCSRRLAFHNPTSDRYQPSGKLQLSTFFENPEKTSAPSTAMISDDLVRFRKVNIHVEECCGTYPIDYDPIDYGKVELRVEGGRPIATFDFRDRYSHPETYDVLNTTEYDVAYVVMAIAKRPRFNGFTLQDLRDVAEYFV